MNDKVPVHRASVWCARLRRHAALPVLTFVVVAMVAPATGWSQDRIIGLVEIPVLHDPVNSGNEDAPHESIVLRAYPAADSAVAFTIAERQQLDSREHGYEQISATVYSTSTDSHGGLWYRLRQATADQEDFGWLSPVDAGQYRDVHSLMEEGLSYLTEDWDRRLFQDPMTTSPATTIPDAERRSVVRIIGIYHEHGSREPWYRLEIVKGSCMEDQPEVVATGWVPAYAASGRNNVWFYSRGC